MDYYSALEKKQWSYITNMANSLSLSLPIYIYIYIYIYISGEREVIERIHTKL